ncbi:MAG: hypothetical protein DDT40_00967 [candidate division WS2 bacterium]|nr:hypothetical protein [Candidatus Psychracetigena formicireducens]
MGQVKTVPIENLDEIKYYNFPDPFEPSRYEAIEKAIEKSEEKYRLFGWFALFERAQQLHGTENLFIDFYQKPEQVHRLLDKINDFTFGVLDTIEPYKGKLDGFRIGDDWGTQRGSLLSIKMFREFFKSRYKEIISKAHGLGMDVWLHSDGRINEVIEEFIEIGLDVVNIQSPHVLGIEEIRRRYSGRITFECCVDLQKSLPFKSRREIGNEARVLIEKWGTSKGGFIGTDYGTTEEDHIAIGVSKERVCWMLEAFRRYGVYR